VSKGQFERISNKCVISTLDDVLGTIKGTLGDLLVFKDIIEAERSSKISTGLKFSRSKFLVKKVDFFR